MTVEELLSALIQLVAEQPGVAVYEVWAEADPSGPIDRRERWWFEPERRIVHL